MKKIIVTGGAGFIGSNLILKLFKDHPDWTIMNIDKLTYASDTGYLKPLRDSERYYFKKIDLVDRDEVKDIVKTFQPDGVFHLAAESHVDNSISGPEPFILSNVVGTFNILEECRQLWQEDEENWKNNRFVHVSTDEVYGELEDDGFFTEQTPYAPNSPYSASKASSDMIVRAYFHTYGMNVVTTNCSNNYGPHQHDEKLIPTVIRNAINHNPIPVYGKGENVRDWLNVIDHCSALETAFLKGKAGEVYNIGGNNEWKNIELVHKLCDLLNEEVGNGPDGDYKNLISFVTDRLGHDFRYAIDASKIKNELGWEPSTDFDGMLRDTVLWYVQKYK
ncbi:MAG: dTDP-glucose 4,6-dehydratase [Balneola sp.]|nr:dTDP-glucose 4,6-dehydratase [Balneola sp.]MBO6650384.1 dTDP-glucose 4,6-dehydratase [Balneola sp.]MBO6710219.1 dTDP-glucose 4,6-dehydratase [Balneola sp.]MBO6798904.1 dTDP-glucose 4,6-dehydratase [Balneola sp.]MBO6870018.1 dTDP-glucose 4,6-dehydratase [Balneola sp.]